MKKQTRKNTTKKQTKNFNYEPLKTELINLGEHLKSNFEKNLKKIKKDLKKTAQKTGRFSVSILEKTTEALKSLDDRKLGNNLAKIFLSPFTAMFIALLIILPVKAVIVLVIFMLILRLFLWP